MNDEQLQNEALTSAAVPAEPRVEAQPDADAPVAAEAAPVDADAMEAAGIETEAAGIETMDELFAELLSEQDTADFAPEAIETAAPEAIEQAALPEATVVAEPELDLAPQLPAVAEFDAEAPPPAIAAVAEVPPVTEVSEDAAPAGLPPLELNAATPEPDAPPIPDSPVEAVAAAPESDPVETASLPEPDALEILEIDEPAGLDWLEAAPEAPAEAAPLPETSAIEYPPPPVLVETAAPAVEPAVSAEAAPAAEEGFDAPDFMLEELLASEPDFGAADTPETPPAARFDAPAMEFASLTGPAADVEDEQPERTSPPLDDLIRGIDAQLEAVAPAAAPVEQPAVTHKQFSQLDDYVVFTLSGGDYALPVRDVAEIGRVPTVTKVPNVPEFVRGITNLRGEIVPVLNLPQLLGLQESAPTARGRVLFLQARDQVAASGLLVDEVKGIQRIPSQQLEHVTGLVDDKVTSVLRGVHGRGDRLLNVLDLEQVFRLEEFQKFERR